MDSPASTCVREFPHTRWSLVIAARGSDTEESAGALETLCRAYWYPLYAYARRCGQSPHDAQDLTQEFFHKLLTKRWLNAADRQKGRLRTFLIAAMKKFMAKEWRRVSAQRRGGGHINVPLDTNLAESRYADASTALEPDATFDQQWALTLLELTVERLRKEFAVADKASDFDLLKKSLMLAHQAIDYATVAAELGITEGAARVAVHRLRKRFRELYREEVAQTLSEGADLETEVRYLARALTHTGADSV